MDGSFIVSTQALTKRFGAIPAVSDLTMQVPRGCVYGFLGPNGAGKSTTIRLLLGLIRPDQGDISVFGLGLRSHRKAILQRVGSLVEAPSLYPRLTGRENLRVVAHLAGIPQCRIDEVLRRVSLSDAADRLAGGYSQGMKQRLGLAMALLNEPEFLILDEPTNGLDPGGIRDVRDLVKCLSAELGVTVLLSSHLLSEVELTCTQLGIIHEGRLLFQGNGQALRALRRGRTLIRTSDPQAAFKLLEHDATPGRLAEGGTIDVGAIGPEETARVNSILVGAGLRVYSIETRDQRLEDLFLELTVKQDL